MGIMLESHQWPLQPTMLRVYLYLYVQFICCLFAVIIYIIRFYMIQCSVIQKSYQWLFTGGKTGRAKQTDTIYLVLTALAKCKLFYSITIAWYSTGLNDYLLGWHYWLLWKKCKWPLRVIACTCRYSRGLGVTMTPFIDTAHWWKLFFVTIDCHITRVNDADDTLCPYSAGYKISTVTQPTHKRLRQELTSTAQHSDQQVWWAMYPKKQPDTHFRSKIGYGPLLCYNTFYGIKLYVAYMYGFVTFNSVFPLSC